MTICVCKQVSVEVALAKAQSKLGIIPKEAYEEIARKAYVENVDVQKIGKASVKQRTHRACYSRSREIARRAGEFIHYGATTQDIMDTGLILQIKKAWPLLKRDLNTARDALKVLAKNIDRRRWLEGRMDSKRCH